MNYEKISVGQRPPFDFNVIIENTVGAEPIKYELDKESGALFVDRFLHTAMTYPGNYGFIPHTLSGDGDPCDVLVVGRRPLIPGCVVRCRPVGALLMEDEAGADEKIIAVPISKLHPYYDDVSTVDELPQILRDQIAHFFEHYKDLEKNKWVKVLRWAGVEEAKQMIQEGIERANLNKKTSDGL